MEQIHPENKRIPSKMSVTSKVLSSPLRYKMIKLFTCPLPCIPRSLPIVGGKSFLEIAIALLFVVLFLFLGLSDPLTAGTMASILGLVLVALAARNNIIAMLLGLTFEHAIFWHKALGCLVLALMLIHGIGEGSNFTGLIIGIAMGVMSVLYVASWYGMFNLFYFGHIALYIALIVPAFLHGALVLGLSVIVWVLDLLIRYVFTKKTVKSQMSILSGEILKIDMPGNSFAYEAGQYCFLRVSMVNGYEYHPFTISSAPSEDTISFHIRKSGDWTSQLYDTVKARSISKGGDMSDGERGSPVEAVVAVEGPYGRLSIDLFNCELYETVVLIGGGIGISPCLAVWKHLLQSASKPKKVILVWLVRESEAAEKMYADQFKGRVDEDREIVLHGGDESITIKDDTIFEYHLFVTQKVTPIAVREVQVEMRSIEAGDGRRKRFNEGRLNLSAFFKGVADYASSLPQEGGRKGRVGVVVCGPFPLITDVHRSVNNVEVRGKVSVDVHEEFFSL